MELVVVLACRSWISTDAASSQVSKSPIVYRRSTPESRLFVAVPESISALVNLTVLNLGGTGISSALDFVIERHSTPESCLFVAVPESIFQLTNLQLLGLSGTGISSALDFVIECRSTFDFWMVCRH